jgi:hypothetical protein
MSVAPKQTEAQTCTAPCYAQTAAELAAGVTPTNFKYPVGNILRYGADPTGVADSSTAVQSALNVAIATNGVMFVPPGKYKCLSAISATMPSATASVSIFGSGAEGTQLIWPTGGGLAINYIGPFNSSHVRDIAFLCGVAGTDTQRGLVLNQTGTIANPALTALSDVTNCVFRGSDGYGQAFYWQSALYIQSVSNVNIANCSYCGANTPTTAGIGVALIGTPTTIGVIYNLLGCTFTDLALGLDYLSNIQGVTVSQSNFTGPLTGIQVLSPATNCNELVVSGSQFACDGPGILTQAFIPNVLISGNTFFVGVTASDTGIELGNAGNFAITGNIFGAPNATFITSNRGVSIDSTNASLPGVISGNVFQTMSVGINLGASSSFVSVQGNTFIGGIININNLGTNNYVQGNPGHNPVGILGPGTVGASPATIANGASPATYYFSQSATFTATVKLGATVIGTMTSDNVVVWNAGPNESAVVTWEATAPTFIESVH